MERHSIGLATEREGQGWSGGLRSAKLVDYYESNPWPPSANDPEELLDLLEEELKRTEWIWFLSTFYPDYHQELATIQDYYETKPIEQEPDAYASMAENRYVPKYTIPEIAERNNLPSPQYLYRILNRWRCPRHSRSDRVKDRGSMEPLQLWAVGTVERTALHHYVHHLKRTRGEFSLNDIVRECREFYPETTLNMVKGFSRRKPPEGKLHARRPR